MTTKSHLLKTDKRTILLALTLFLLAACSDQSNQNSLNQDSDEESLANEKITQELSQTLINATNIIASEKETENAIRNKNEFNKLSEEDRQALIDLTLQESAQKIADDANKTIIEQERNDR